MSSLFQRCIFVSAISFLFISYGLAEDNLVLWYKMNEINQDGKIADASTNGLDLTLGSGCWLTNGIAGPALHFNGTADAWSTFAGPALGSRTVSLLFRREEENGPIYPQGASTWPYIITDLSRMHIHIGTAIEYSLVYVAGRAMGGQGNFKRNQWNHMAWVYEETSTGEPNVVTGNCKMYLNGILNGTSPTYTLTNTSVTATTYLGNHSNKTRPIYGELDEVKIYSAALTDAQVKQEALRAMETGKTPRLIGHWAMEEIVETNSTRLVRDLSGNGHDLQLDDGCQLTNGIDGMALSYDGTQDAGASFINGSAVSSWSMAVWVRQDKATYPEIVTGNYYPRIIVGTDSLMVHLKSQDNGMTYQGYGHPGSQVVTIRPDVGVWAHYAVTTHMAYNEGSSTFSSIPTFYLNGEKIAEGVEKVTDQLVWSPSYTMCIGNNAINGVRPLTGEMDDFRYYDGVLSDQQVKAIYEGLPSVSAGDDFITDRDLVTLQGQVGDENEHTLRSGYGAELTWSLVSAPAGGEGATIQTAESETTQATLPVVGKYVFRLTAQTEFQSVYDEVTISRVASPTSNLAPTVSLDSTASVTIPASLLLAAVVADQDSELGTLRVAWSKVSGPGGVYFADSSSSNTEASFLEAGTYVLRCTADDGSDTGSADITVAVSGDSSAISLTNGLVRYYPMNSAPFDEEVISGSTAMTFEHLENGITGYGLRSYNANGYADTQLALPEYGEVNTAVTNPTHLAFSLWMYHDTADTNVSANAALLHVSYNLGLYYSCQDAEPGFILFQQGVSGAVTQYNYPCPAVSPTNRWTHVYACYDREDGTELQLYIDGVKQTKTSSSGSYPARVRPDQLRIGGMTVTTGGAQGPIAGYSRVFPGVIDEVRIYNRELTDAEVAALATQPVRVNLEPLAELGTATIIGNKGASKPLEVSVFDDGLPTGSTLESQWRIVSGDENGISIADETSASTSISLLELGTYTLQLVTTDGERTSYSELITVIVNPRGTVIIVQ